MNYESSRIYDWSRLNDEANFILDKVLQDWEVLLTKKCPENVYHQYLFDHAGLFFSRLYNVFFVISKLRLGADYIVDFVIPSDNHSNGYEYLLVEIETPYYAPFTKKGIPSSRLSESIQQIHNWAEWINQNRNEAHKLFPTWGLRLYRKPNIRFMIIIGRRSNTATWIDRRVQLSNRLHIEIRSFDYLTDLFRESYFGKTKTTGSVEYRDLSTQQLNDLANPFYKAFSDQTWREIIKKCYMGSEHPTFYRADILAQYKDYNGCYFEFIEWYTQLKKS